MLIVLALVAGCGGAGGPTHVPTAAPDSELAIRSAEDAASRSCGAFSRRKLARDLGVRSTDPAVLAGRFARDYRPAFRARVERACLLAIMRRGR